MSDFYLMTTLPNGIRQKIWVCEIKPLPDGSGFTVDPIGTALASQSIEGVIDQVLIRKASVALEGIEDRVKVQRVMGYLDRNRGYTLSYGVLR